MKPYRIERERQAKRAKFTGVVLTLGVHAAALAVALSFGLSYLYPPPPETTFVINFQEDAATTRARSRVGSLPQGEKIEREKPVELTQQAASPYVNDAANETPAAQPDDFGDVETPEPPVKEEPKLDPRASFPGMAKADHSATAPQAASETSTEYKRGQSSGNTAKGVTEGTANAHLEGRHVVGDGIQKPAYAVQKEGIVVVQIKVDQYGTVTEAVPGVEGTTVTDRTLWNAARKAAMETHFNMSAEAPVLQTGTITYIFKLL